MPASAAWRRAPPAERREGADALGAGDRGAGRRGSGAAAAQPEQHAERDRDQQGADDREQDPDVR
jgi:hypothetical protein